MNTVLYGISIFILSLIRQGKMSKDELKEELNRIIDELYFEFGK